MTITLSKPGLEPGEGGHDVGRDPRTMTRDDLAALGHEASDAASPPSATTLPDGQAAI